MSKSIPKIPNERVTLDNINFRAAISNSASDKQNLSYFWWLQDSDRTFKQLDEKLIPKYVIIVHV